MKVPKLDKAAAAAKPGKGATAKPDKAAVRASFQAPTARAALRDLDIEERTSGCGARRRPGGAAWGGDRAMAARARPSRCGMRAPCPPPRPPPRPAAAAAAGVRARRGPGRARRGAGVVGRRSAVRPCGDEAARGEGGEAEDGRRAARAARRGTERRAARRGTGRASWGSARAGRGRRGARPWWAGDGGAGLGRGGRRGARPWRAVHGGARPWRAVRGGARPGQAAGGGAPQRGGAAHHRFGRGDLR
nr:uncharacterized protein LOC127310660 [Lolium perenne]